MRLLVLIGLIGTIGFNDERNVWIIRLSKLSRRALPIAPARIGLRSFARSSIKTNSTAPSAMCSFRKPMTCECGT